ENTYRDAWMPSLSLFWRPVNYLEFDAYAKRSYGQPSFNDLYYSQMGNSSLVPELAEQYGLDIRFSGRKPANYHWDVRVSPYFNRISNKIVAIPTSSQFRWTMLNIGLVDVTGLDTKAEFGVNRGEWFMEGTLRYSLQQALDHSDSDSRTYGNQIPYIPLHSGGFGLEARYGYWSLCWDTSISGGKWSRTANIADYYIEPWSISDASVSRHYYLTGLAHRGTVPELTVTLNLGNVFNRPYQIVQGYPMPGFNALLSMEIKW
ncbi:MAG: TonB-dependent receptor, partial [Bacteroidales bacterium]|nr:TonB-dependent receptor [Bacteroidales bacterium]